MVETFCKLFPEEKHTEEMEMEMQIGKILSITNNCGIILQ